MGEEALYQALWNAARPEERESRIVTVGWRGMSSLCRLTPKNCKLNTHRLIQKLALEVVSRYNVPEQIGTTYRVYSYRAILERRRRAGMEWVVRNRGVEFVNPTTGVGMTPGVDSTTGADLIPAPGVARTTPATVQPTTAPEVDPTPQLGNSEEVDSGTSSTVIAALRRYAQAVDDFAVRTLLAACRNKAPDATDEEIVHFIHVKAKAPGVDKPLAFLLTAVPRCFEGESFRQFRMEQRQSREQARLRIDRLRREAEQLLAAPDSAEDMRQWARETLAQLES